MKNTELQHEAAALVTRWFAVKVAQVLGFAEGDIDVGKPAHSYGIDSLVAIDFKNWFAREIMAEIEVFMLLGSGSLESLAAVAAEKSRIRIESQSTQ